jgi:hypothetical protein
MDQKIRYEIEFPINSSPQLLYQYISTPRDFRVVLLIMLIRVASFFTFIWNDSEEKQVG